MRIFHFQPSDPHNHQLVEPCVEAFNRTATHCYVYSSLGLRHLACVSMDDDGELPYHLGETLGEGATGLPHLPV